MTANSPGDYGDQVYVPSIWPANGHLAVAIWDLDHGKTTTAVAMFVHHVHIAPCQHDDLAWSVEDKATELTIVETFQIAQLEATLARVTL